MKPPSRLRPGLMATAGTALLTLTINAALAHADDGAAGPAEVALVMGGSGDPIPPASYVDAVDRLYIAPNYPEAVPQALFTPEGFYGEVGVKQLPIDTSVAQGVTILDNTISQQIAEGNHVVAFGLSQSALIASLEMSQLAANDVPSADVSFVMIGDPMNPDGGLWERFAPVTVPSLGLTFYGATPDDLYPTDIYTLEYDGAADFPRYTIDLLADLNAFAGILYVHGTYPDLTSAEVATAIELPTQGPTLTHYFMIPTQDLPLLDPLRAIPVVGTPLADLLQPDLKVLVNLGYGDPEYGWSQGPANVATPFGLFPSLADLEKVPGLLVSGTQQGIHDFVAALSDPSPDSSGLSVPNLLAANPLTALGSDLSAVLSSASPIETVIEDLQAANTDIVNTLSSVTSTAYAVLLPTADILNAAVTTLPSYDLNLFLDGIGQAAGGNLEGLVNAVGDPIAANTALLTLLGGLEFIMITDAVTTIMSDLTGLIP
ncbi:PE-PPE domain-containing protein [Mycobacterium sp.]|uniref:PE-PPE domain-containing protein n=1 Tax=Mycobacterium sp. TaxID=1785 RepID=UPI00126DF09E|nr:PE-PPE domain-containing protein [Mycobacterium sp.]KAA8962553.1 MAG: PE-PPE domain-containing protein [Mycobacterium sp.]